MSDYIKTEKDRIKAKLARRFRLAHEVFRDYQAEFVQEVDKRPPTLTEILQIVRIIEAEETMGQD